MENIYYLNNTFLSALTNTNINLHIKKTLLLVLMYDGYSSFLI